MRLENITRHPESALMLAEIKKIRDCVKGSAFVKAERSLYLPHPSALDTTSQEAMMRYNKYLSGAQFQGIPAQTLKAWVGKIDPAKTQVELPEKIAYLETDIDADGLSMNGAISQVLSNVLAVKWHVLVADYQGLSGVDLESLTVADIDRLNPRATVKQYTRENVYYWHFKRVNGKMQLAYIMLREEGLEFDETKINQFKIESFLVLALDENGNYYQQKLVKTSDGIEEGEKSSVLVGGAPLKWLPVQVVMDEPMQSGAMPLELGYLSPIVDLTLHNYIISADKKEAMLSLPPTINYYGVGENEWEQFQSVNGRSYVGVGSTTANLWPTGVTAEILSAQTDLSGYDQSIKDNNDEMRSLGASFPSDAISNKTATEASYDASEQVARLAVIAQCTEEAMTRICLYCGMFEGLWSQDDIEQNEQVVIQMNRDFSNAKLTAQEVQQIIAVRMSGGYDQEEYIKVLAQGGWTVSDAEELLARLDSGAGMSLNLQGNA